MIKNRNSKNLPLLLWPIFFVLPAFLLLTCNRPNNFERDILLNTGWETVKSPNLKKQKNSIATKFKTNADENKIYLIELKSQSMNVDVTVNNFALKGNKTNSGATFFNITEYVRHNNIIEIKGNNVEIIDLRLHCVNKFFIPEIDFEFDEKKTNSTDFALSVKIKNAADNEKQGILEYKVITNDNQVVHVQETPVFISGNTENLYQHEIVLPASETEVQNIRVDCNLFEKGELIDQNTTTYKIENQETQAENKVQ